MPPTVKELTQPMHEHEPPPAAFLADVLEGMRQSPKRLPCKYFYDQLGCELFEEICTLDEYYVTRTELAIMQQRAHEMSARLGPRCMVIELGSGSGVKTRILLDHLDQPAAYLPVDIARETLEQNANDLRRRYRDLDVLPVCADFTGPFVLPECQRTPDRKVVYFPGSTLGNFGPSETAALFAQIGQLCGTGGGLLIGIDLQKDTAILDAAYDDARGVTAAFNLNLLARINRELEGSFQLDQFHHRAFYNAAAGRIEMHLISRAHQAVRIGGETFKLARDEAICTEYSYKYDLDEFRHNAAQAGLQVNDVWTDARQWFAVVYLLVK
jgi:dimethylhistidine N-methyltransferase